MIWTIFILTLSAVVLKSLSDSSRDKRRLELSHFYDALSVLALLAVVFYYTGTGWKEFLLVPFGLYIANRILFFDIVYNIMSGNDISYIGESCWYDDFVTWIFKKQSPAMWLWVRIVIWVVYCGYVLFDYLT